MSRVEVVDGKGAPLPGCAVDEPLSLRPDLLLERYQRRVYAVIHRMTGVHSEADDLCQEVFLQVFRSLGSFRAGTNLDSWIYRIAMNVSVDHLRRQGSRRKLQEDLRQRSGSPSPESGITEETRGAVRSAMDGLVPEQKAVVVLRLYEGLSHEAIAEIVGVPAATVRWRFFAALEKLEKDLKPQLDDLV